MKIEIVPLADITIPENRMRKEFDADELRALADSIISLGLLHPPVLRSTEDTLVAGERRLRALRFLAARNTPYSCAGQEIPVGSVGIIRACDLSMTELLEAELDENLKRVDLTWQERDTAIAMLHELRQSQLPEGVRQQFKDTAAEIDEIPFTVRNSTIIAKHLDDPDVAKAKDSREAMKIITRKAEQGLREMLAEQYGRDSSVGEHKLQHGEAIEGLRSLNKGTVDVFVTDPPYGINAQAFGSMADIAHRYDDTVGTWEPLMFNLARESYAVAKAQAHAYVFCDPRRFFDLSVYFAEAGWDVWPVPLIWDKSNGMLPRPDHGPRRCYEAILFANKGDKPVTAVYSDVIRISAEQDKQHAAQKPVALYLDLLRRSTFPGDVVCDPFAGSGTIFPAATAASCRAIGFELDPSTYALARGRMEEGV